MGSRTRPLCLDLFCGGGGAARGIVAAGFDCIGVDLAVGVAGRGRVVRSKWKAMKRAYPGELVIGDALNPPVELAKFDFIWASPPCQRYSTVLKAREEYRERHPDMVAPTRELLQSSGVPWCMENVPGAPMRADIVLTGAMFDLEIVRERIFEIEGFPAPFALAQRWYRKTVTNGDLATVAGQGANNPWNLRRKRHKGAGPVTRWRDLPEDLKHKLSTRNNVAGWRAAMNIDDSMTRDLIREAVPPAYAEFIARAAMEQINGTAAAR